IRYGAWYLDPKMWRKQKVNEPLEAPKAAADAIQNLGKRFSEKVLHLWNLCGEILILVQGCRAYVVTGTRLHTICYLTQLQWEGNGSYHPPS
uniref:Uncharacterized protein n=1 Tax=Terrapene triunguis TaxID=2587831 RepID=A0A674IDH9_9SAUR